MRLPRLEKWDVVRIEWDDAHGGDLCWEAIEDKHRTLEPIITVGQYDSKTEDVIVVVLSRDSRGNVDCYISVPIVGISKVTKLDC